MRDMGDAAQHQRSQDGGVSGKRRRPQFGPPDTARVGRAVDTSNPMWYACNKSARMAGLASKM